MANPREAFDYVMDHEDRSRSGVITYDAGGATRFGIAAKYHPEEFPALEEMSVSQALNRAWDLFQRDYWQPAFNELNSQAVASKLADLCYQCGTARGIKIAQQAVNKLGYSVTVDGIMGPETRRALNLCEEIYLLHAMCALAREEHIKEYAAAGKKIPAGILARDNDFPLPAGMHKV